jgi:transposase
VEAALRRQNEDLQLQLAATRTQLSAANAQICALTDQVSKLAELVAKGNDRVTELFAIANRKTRGSKRTGSDKAPEPPPSLDDAAKTAFAERPTAPKLPEKKKRQATFKPKGRKALPERLEEDEHHLRSERCGCCGGIDLEKVGSLKEEKLTVVAKHFRRRVVERDICVCKHCGERNTPRSLPAPFARSKATCEFLAWLVHQKFAMLTPLDRIRRDLKSRGIELSMSYLVSQIEWAAKLLDAVDGEHWKELLAGSWMATDATGLKVLIPKLKGTHSGYLEVYRRDELAVFQYEPHKGGDVLEAKLKGFSGVLVADAEHRHNGVFASGAVLEAGCNAHGRRKFRDAEATRPVLAAEGGAFIAAIFVAESKAREKGLQGAALRAWRKKKVPPLGKKLLDWMNAVEPTLLPSEPLKLAIAYYRNHWDALFRFVEHPEIPLDNSGSEREYQQVAKMRLNSLFAGSSEGAHRMAVLLGIVATCRAIGVNSEEYLGWAMTRLGTHRDLYGLAAKDLTPAAYKRSLA